jgi:predicted nucleic acid-binding protein
MDSTFLDTSFAIALAVESDAHHSRALRLADRVDEERPSIVTTRAVLTEIGNYMATPQRRSYAASYIDALQRDPAVEIVPSSDDLFRRGLNLFRTRSDKAWGLTDCISFVVMRERGIWDALTADRDFEQAGFNALL